MFKSLLLLSLAACVLAELATISAESLEHQSEAVDRIVGGFPVSKAQSRFVVIFKWVSNKNNFCSGTLVSSFKVLTTAACARSMIGASVDAVMNTLTPFLPPDRDAVIRRVVSVLVHPNYSPAYKSNDLGIVTLQSSVPFAPMPIDYGNVNLNGATLLALGWGTFNNVQNLRYAAVRTTEPVRCYSYYGNRFPIFSDGRYSICMQGSGVASCTTDAGGPIITSDWRYLVGVNSWADCRTGQPIVAVRLKEYRNWIEANRF